MARTNHAVRSNLKTHEGAPACTINAEQQLRRSVMACMLWENTFYESGISIAERIADTIKKVKPAKVAEIAFEARSKMKLRHVPLLITREMARSKDHKPYVANTLSNVIQRADELSEFVSMYWKEGKRPLSAQVKKGLASAFTKFDRYAISKYNRDSAVKLRDVLFMVHAKPKDKEQEALWKDLVDGTLTPPDTWEVAISAAKGDFDKTKAEWERLIAENKLGAMAYIRNLRNMLQAGVNRKTITDGLAKVKTDRVLPFRFIAAAKHVPEIEGNIETLMLKCLEDHEKLPGRTVLLVDVSGSMSWAISDKTETNRIDVACGLAILLREVCEEVDILTFSDQTVQVPARHGFALRDAVNNSQRHSGTDLGTAVSYVKTKYKNLDRLIIITDEQSQTKVGMPHAARNYMINVATNRNGVGYGNRWVHIDGWSEAIVDYIQQYEKSFTE